MLVDEGVTARIDDHLDAVTKLLALFETLDAVVDPVHLFTTQNGIGPEEHRNLSLDRGGTHGQIGRLPIGAVFFHAG